MHVEQLGEKEFLKDFQSPLKYFSYSKSWGKSNCLSLLKLSWVKTLGSIL